LKSSANPAKKLETETISKPIVRTILSPKRFTQSPAIGADANLMKANTETTELAASALTPKDLAKTGIAGATIPNPIATKKAINERTATSLGSPRSQGLCRIIRPIFRINVTISSSLTGVSGLN
jgi:hypothetical protein